MRAPRSATSANSFILLGRRLDAADRAYYRALRELRRIQESDGPEPDPPAQPCPQREPGPQVPEDTPHLASIRNILPSPAVEPPAEPQGADLDVFVRDTPL